MRSSPPGPVASLAPTSPPSTAWPRDTISRIATPDAVAAWREHQVTLAISPVNPDDLLNPTYEESSFEGNVDSQCHLPQNWLLDSWRATVAGDVDNVQAVHLVNWGADADADRINPVDLVRLVQWAPTADNPWSYVASNVAELYRLGPEGETLAYLLSAAPERAVRMVESGCVAKPRAYLATAIRNARAAPPARLDADRGGYVASWLPDGRLPWLDPPAPSPAVELEQPAKPSIWPDLASTAADPRPLEAQKSGARHPSAFTSSGGERKLEHGQATDDSARHAAQ